MGDGQGNPFISNPFMQGSPAKKTPAPEPKPRRQTQRISEKPSGKLTEPSEPIDKPAQTPKKAKSDSLKAAAKSASKSNKGTQKAKSASRTNARAHKKNTSSSPPPLPTQSYTNSGYKVQVLAKIPMPTNPNMPGRDYLWFATYSIIPRVGDCIFHDGRYFRVDAVFLYENMSAGWCADLEVSHYVRRY